MARRAHATMSLAATSLKLPQRLKARVEGLARRAGESPHSFMVRALESQVEAAERYEAFLRDGMRADQAMQHTGLGYDAKDVHAYLEARIRGRKARRPKAVRWRG
jgi:predicted transcriptional regulator